MFCLKQETVPVSNFWPGNGLRATGNGARFQFNLGNGLRATGNGLRVSGNGLRPRKRSTFLILVILVRVRSSNFSSVARICSLEI